MSDTTSIRSGRDDGERPRPGKPEVLVAPPDVLERGLCTAVAAAKAADPLRPVVVVARGHVEAAAIPAALARGLGVAANVEVFAYADFVRTSADARHGGRTAHDLTRTQARVLARVVTAHAKGWFEPLAGTPGFADAFCDFLADLRGARLSPEALTRAGLPIEIRRKLSSLATSAREFEDRRGRRRTHEDRAEDATVVVERTMGAVPLMLYGVTAATDADARLIERVCHSMAVSAFLPALRAPAAAALAPTLEVLRRCGALAAASPPEPEAAAAPTSLTHLRRHLFRVPDAAAPDDSTVRLVSAAGPAAEAEEAASACTAWAEAGISFDDMAVAVPSRSRVHADLVVAALGRAGVPCADLTDRPPAGTAAGRAALLHARTETGDAATAWADRVDAAVAALDASAEGYDEVVAALGELRVDEMCSPPADAAFADAVQIALTSAARGPAARHRFETARASGGVTVVSTADAGLAAHDAVVVVGLADGLLPREPEPASLLTDTERTRLNEALSADLPLASAAGDHDPADFALAVVSARSELVLVRPRGGVDGNRLAASPYFRAAAIALEGTAVPAAGVDTCSRVDVRARSHAGGPTDAAHLGAWAWNARLDGNRYTEFEGIVEPSDLERLDPAPPLHGLSPTRLETYAGCPFRFLAENVYGTRRSSRTAVRLAIDPRDRGSLVHAVLERFLRALGADTPLAVSSRADQLGLLDATLDEVFAEFEARVPPIAVVRDLTCAAIRTDLHGWWEIEAAEAAEAAAAAEAAQPLWRPVALEVAFGRDGGDGHAPVVVPTSVGDVEIAGRIDRVDVSGDGKAFRVLDYKTGGVNTGAATVQLPVYLRAAAEITSLPVAAGSAEYFHVSRRAGFVRTRPDVDAGAGLEALVEQISASIAAGDFHADPATCRGTGACEYDEICGRRVTDRALTRASDPRTRGGGPS